MNTNAPHTAAVFGSYGHTARFIIDELHRRGFALALGGRDPEKMRALADAHPHARTQVVSVDDPASLDVLLKGASVVVNSAGPFGDTTGPVIAAALRAGIHYIDITGEQPVTRQTFETYRDRLAGSGRLFLPALGFFGGLPDLLATAAMGDWAAADDIAIAFALSSWHPTEGTRKAGVRSAGKRVTFTGGRLVPAGGGRADPVDWDFPGLGTRPVHGMATADHITLSQHLKTPRIRTFMNEAPLSDLGAADTPPPVAVSRDGRSAQTFVVDVVVRRGEEERAASASGRDIYAVTAPLVAEAVARILDGRTAPNGVATGMRAAGEVFDADGFLSGLDAIRYARR
ncbi:saccharopine dehydrogenase NADP-binding domain-containing protein [Streptomyces sp. ITFR-16]|uniref:saccharopine dehydrogenase NADP-binding domain-containing protein n=1 Tax=Streptomyces sp. ITFR-16 TaxID=3075198 RepID=UPI0028895D9A|nr:saccharopine dehydrogenase NADP-binding domain-containing protein [Streptomyces sp. ITFR-16]WNI20553.1 saccharopine dehydrogenase NADP-binding domain-containing protein [Streptomyces sp. ITFR-16]